MATKRRIGRTGLKAAKAAPGKGRMAAGGARRGAKAAKRNAYLQALLHDKRTQKRLRQAMKSARIAYLRATRRGDAAEALLDDRKGRRELRRAITSLRETGAALQGAKARKRRATAIRVLVPVAVLGGAGALAANAAAREKILALVTSSEGASDGETAAAAQEAPVTSDGTDEPVRSTG